MREADQKYQIDEEKSGKIFRYNLNEIEIISLQVSFPAPCKSSAQRVRQILLHDNRRLGSKFL